MKLISGGKSPLQASKSHVFCFIHILFGYADSPSELCRK